jgi:hypothetical protein
VPSARDELRRFFATEADLDSWLEQRRDPWAFIQRSARTWDEHEIDPTKRASKPFPEWGCLRETVEAVRDNPAVVILKARQLMLSWLMSGYAAWEILFHTYTRVLVISKDQEASYGLRDRVRHILENLRWSVSYQEREELLVAKRDKSGRIIRYEKDKASIIRLSGRAEAVFLPQSRSAGRSYPARVVMGDEFAFWPWAEEIYTGVVPTLTGAEKGDPRAAKIILWSTPNGVGTKHDQIHKNAERMGFVSLTLDHTRHPFRDPATDRGREWMEQEKKRLGPRKFAQEHECKALQSGRPVFDQSYLQRRAVPPTGAWIRREAKRAAKVGDLSPFLLGIDAAEGLEDGDATCLQVIHKETGRQVRRVSANVKADTFFRKVKTILDLCPGPIGVEKASEGGTLILLLQKHGYGDRLYRHREYDQRGRSRRRVGWVTSSKSKPIMVDELEMALREREVLVSWQETLEQLMVFEYKDGGSHSGAPSGYHDDEVMALAIAWQMRKSAGMGLESIG